MNTQKSTDKFWKDETGVTVPFSRLTKAERLREKICDSLTTKAMTINKTLNEFKTLFQKNTLEVYSTTMAELTKEKRKDKGNFTFFNFDRSIKIEVAISERIEFDDLTIKACKSKLDEFLNKNIESKDDFIKEMVMDAFANTKGRLDSKKVMNLLRYRGKIKAVLFQDALDLLEKAIRKPDSKSYYRIWVKNNEGKYEVIDLNFSSI